MCEDRNFSRKKYQNIFIVPTKFFPLTSENFYAFFPQFWLTTQAVCTELSPNIVKTLHIISRLDK